MAKFPLKLTEGAHTVTIRKLRNGIYHHFRIEHKIAGVPQRQKKSNLDEALTIAQHILADLNNRPLPENLSQAEVAEFIACRQAIKTAGLDLSVYTAVHELIELHKIAKGKPLKEAILTGTKWDTYTATLQEIAPKYLRAIAKSNSKDYVKRATARVKRFVQQFDDRKLHEITAEEITHWLDGLQLAERAHNNERATVITFCRWAQKQKLFPAGEIAASTLPILKAHRDIQIFTISQIRTLLETVRQTAPELLAYTVIGCFTGIRPKELTRLTPEDIRWDHQDIEVRAKTAKTGDRRLVDIPPNLAQWLRLIPAGPIAPKNPDGKLAKIACDCLDIPVWPKDVLRHSYISYAVAKLESVGKVALIAGNSEQVIKNHYLRRVTHKEGLEYFMIVPD